MEDFHKILSVDLDGVMLGQKYAIKHMKKNGGSIINLCSIAGLIGIPNLFSYNAAKGAVRLITKSAALYCCDKNYPIRINSVHPGYAHTPMVDAYPEMRTSLEALHPMAGSVTQMKLLTCASSSLLIVLPSVLVLNLLLTGVTLLNKYKSLIFSH